MKRKQKVYIKSKSTGRRFASCKKLFIFDDETGCHIGFYNRRHLSQYLICESKDKCHGFLNGWYFTRSDFEIVPIPELKLPDNLFEI